MLAPLHSIIDKGKHEKYLFLPLYANTENSLVPASATRIEQDWLLTVKRQKGDYASFSELSNIFKQKDSELNTSAIIINVTKSSTKPWSGATTNCHLHSS